MNKTNYLIFGSMLSLVIIVGAWSLYMQSQDKPSGPKVIHQDFQGEAEALFRQANSYSRQQKYAQAVDCYEKARSNYMKMREAVVAKYGSLPEKYSWIDREIRSCNMALKDNREFKFKQEQENERY